MEIWEAQLASEYVLQGEMCFCLFVIIDREGLWLVLLRNLTKTTRRQCQRSRGCFSQNQKSSYVYFERNRKGRGRYNAPKIFNSHERKKGTDKLIQLTTIASVNYLHIALKELQIFIHLQRPAVESIHNMYYVYT